MTKKSHKQLSQEAILNACKKGDVREIIYQLKNGIVFDEDILCNSNEFDKNVIQFFIKNIFEHVKYFSSYENLDFHVRYIVKFAFRYNEIEQVKKILYSNLIPYVIILSEAILNNNLEFVKFMFESERLYPNRCFYECGYANNIEILKFLIKKSEERKLDFDGQLRSCMLGACFTCSYKVACFLLHNYNIPIPSEEMIDIYNAHKIHEKRIQAYEISCMKLPEDVSRMMLLY